METIDNKITHTREALKYDLNNAKIHIANALGLMGINPEAVPYSDIECLLSTVKNIFRSNVRLATLIQIKRETNEK